ncbi:MAG: aminodeoxychorismate/anthranilate synthase component II [Eubacterium sp.]|nr:aminodeoxychorismate/anthranilate synthase component II [Eubacterium sp.]
MILLIDNYDSFSYNLYQMIGELDSDIKVVRNDAITPDDIRKIYPLAVVLSPGPGKPSDAGVCIDCVKELSGEIPMLGICLGHQAICEAFGATVTYAGKIMHGKQSETEFDTSCPIFAGIPEKAQVGRYHSLAADVNTIPKELRITAKTADGEVMAVSHISDPTYGLQFHPESILTPDGKKMLKSFLDESRRWKMSAHDSSVAAF